LSLRVLLQIPLGQVGERILAALRAALGLRVAAAGNLKHYLGRHLASVTEADH
jgi:hypothetical protein